MYLVVYFAHFAHAPRAAPRTAPRTLHDRSNASFLGLPMRSMPAEVWSPRGTRESAAVGTRQVSTTHAGVDNNSYLTSHDKEWVKLSILLEECRDLYRRL